MVKKKKDTPKKPKKIQSKKKSLLLSLISDDEDEDDEDEDDEKKDEQKAITGVEACQYYEEIKWKNSDKQNMMMYEDKPYKWWFDHREDPKLFYLEKIAIAQYVDPTTNNIAERGYKTSRGLINYQTSQLSDDKIHMKQIIMDYINKKNKTNKVYAVWDEQQLEDDEEDEEDDDDDDDDDEKTDSEDDDKKGKKGIFVEKI